MRDVVKDHQDAEVAKLLKNNNDNEEAKVPVPGPKNNDSDSDSCLMESSDEEF